MDAGGIFLPGRTVAQLAAQLAAHGQLAAGKTQPRRVNWKKKMSQRYHREQTDERRLIA